MTTTIEFAQNSVLSAGHQTYALASLIALPSTPDLPAVLVVRAYDRDVYSGTQSYDYGAFASPAGGTLSAGTQYQPTVLYFDLKNGVYVSRATGEALTAYTFTSSDQNHRSVYLSLFTNDTGGATYDSKWLDPAWTHHADLNVVTRTDYVDPTPNAATPQEIAAIAKSFIGQVWNSEGCWLLTSNISAAAGASLPVTSAVLNTAAEAGNGQWKIVFDGAHQSGDWRALLQVGDIVELGFLNGKAHIATVTSGAGHDALWVDNSGVSAMDGTPSDIVIQGEHSVELWTGAAVDNTVTLFRLGAAGGAPSTLPAPIAAPVVTAHPQSIHVGQSLSVASLFSVQDPNLLPMSSYQIGDLNGAGHLNLNGATNLASAAQQAAGIVIVGAADLAKLQYVAALGPDALTITAFNGQSWGTARVAVTGWIDPPPTVTGASLAVHAASQLLPVASLFSAASAPGHTITQYRFIDADHSGQLLLADPRLNLASNDEAALGIYRVNALDVGALSWKALADTGTLSVSAFDGVQWSDFAAVTIEGRNTAPTVTPTPRMNLSVGQATPVASLFTVADADHDAITMVSIYDFYDNIALNGATDYCPFPHAYEVTLAELAKVTYTPSTVMGGLQGITINAYDGTSWSPLTAVQFTTDDPAPIVRAGTGSQVAPGTVLPLAQLFSVLDPYAKPIVKYMVHDPAGGGAIALNGARDLATASEHASGTVVFAAADLAKVSFHANTQVGSEPLHISAYNGAQWGDAFIEVGTADGGAPTFFAPAATLDVGRSVALSSLMTAYAAAGRAITTYLVRDPAGGGTLRLNGAHDIATAEQHARGEIAFAAAELDQVQFVTSGTEGDETIGLAAFDGAAWGQADLVVSAKNYGRPVVTTFNMTVHAGQSVSVQDLFKTADPSGSAITGYQITDVQHRIALNGATNFYAAEQYKGFYGIFPADLAKVAFIAGAPGTQTITIEAGNKAGASSMAETVTITVLSNPVITATTVTVGIHQSIAVSDLFSAANPSGKALLAYRIEQDGTAGKLYLNGAVNLASASEQAHGTVIVAAADLSKLHYTGAAQFGSDTLTISAYDGESWGGSAVPVTTIDGTPPQVSGRLAAIETDQTVALSSLFSASAHSGAPITFYKIDNPAGGGKLVLNGAVNTATPTEQAQQGSVIVAAADLPKLQYVGADTPGTETLRISAFDGQSWGTAYLPITSEKTAPPLVTPATAFLEPGQSVKFDSLFGVTDPNDKAVSYYIIHDAANHLELNGATNLWAAQQSSGYYWIGAADIDKVNYLADADGVYRYSLIVNDGNNFSAWTEGLAVVGRERLLLPPALTPALATLALQQKVALSTLFNVHDPVGNAIVRYSVFDPAGGGRLLLNGAADLATPVQHAQGLVVFAAADLAKVQYQGAASSAVEALAIGADDGLGWGTADIAVTSALLPPVIVAAGTHIEINQELDAGALFSATAASGATIAAYKFQDPAGGGRLLLGGAVNLASAAQQAQGISIVSALDLGHVRYIAQAAAGSETLLVGAYDGANWGAANIVLATDDNRAPLIVQSAASVDLNASVPLDTLFKGSSISGKPIVQYLIQDPQGGGHVDINSAQNLASAAQQSAGITVVSAYDLGKLLYTAGPDAGAETLRVTAYDGQNSSSANVAVASVTAALPVLIATPVTIHVGDAVRLADLVSINDPNGHAIKWYFVLDMSLGIDLNGAANLAVSPYYDYHGHYDFNNAADWSRIDYVGQTPGTVRIVVQADDGYHVSNYLEEVITVVDKGVPIPVAPVGVIAGSGGDDLLHRNGMANTIDGGAGTDTLVYAGAKASYVIGLNQDGSFTVKNTSGASDTLVHVERLQFDDAQVALDTGVAGDGHADAGQIYRLYLAALQRAPDLAGLGFWMGLADKGMPLTAIASGMTASAEFRNLYGNLNDHQFVDQLYQNVLHRSGERDGIAFWDRLMDDHVLSREQVLVAFADSHENIAALVGVVQNGIAYIG